MGRRKLNDIRCSWYSFHWDYGIIIINCVIFPEDGSIENAYDHVPLKVWAPHPIWLQGNFQYLCCDYEWNCNDSHMHNIGFSWNFSIPSFYILYSPADSWAINEVHVRTYIFYDRDKNQVQQSYGIVLIFIWGLQDWGIWVS